MSSLYVYYITDSKKEKPIDTKYRSR